MPQDVSIVNDKLLHAIRWAGNDLELTFAESDEMPLRKGVVIRVSDAVGVIVSMEFGSQSGMGLVWNATAIPEPNGVALLIDFAGAPKGSISANGTKIDVASLA